MNNDEAVELDGFWDTLNSLNPISHKPTAQGPGFLDHITSKYGFGMHFHPSPSIRPLGLRGKEFGWLADDLRWQKKRSFHTPNMHPFVP